MVFCGKASLSCKNCRVRRIKCNKLEPECSQCIRAGKKCPGYRDQLSLMFRDETVKVRRKFEEGNGEGSAGATEDAGPATASASAASPDTVTFPLKLEPSTSPSSSGATNIGQFPAFRIVQAETPAEATDTKDGRERGDGTKKAVADAVVHVPAKGSLSANRKGSSLTADNKASTQPKRQQKKRQEAAAAAAASAAVAVTAAALAPSAPGLESPSNPIIILAPQRTTVELGFKFYLDHYLLGHPESPDEAGEKSLDKALDRPWYKDDAAKLIAAAVGLEGMANLTDNEEYRIIAWQSYVKGLRSTSQALANPGDTRVDNVMRCIILLAMFEIARGANDSFGSANVHVMGAAALMNKIIPLFPPDRHPFRGLLQICFALLITFQVSGSPMLPMVNDYIISGAKGKPVEDQIMTKLLLILGDFINASAYVRRSVLVDGRQESTNMVVQLLRLEARLITWEHSVSDEEVWRYTEGHVSKLPPEATYHGRFHRYSDIPTARIWSYYRWARILLNQMLLDFIDRCPQSVALGLEKLRVGKGKGNSKVKTEEEDAVVDNTQTEKLRRKALRTIRECAEETFISTPTYWRHPSLTVEEYAAIASPLPVYGENGGAGSVGLLPMLFHLQVAACAPGTSRDDFRWALDVIDIVWKQMGLKQARSLGNLMRAHEAAMERRASGEPLLLVSYQDVAGTL